MFDFHTHNLSAPAGSAIVNLPREILLSPQAFCPVAGGLYSAGIHPWWTADDSVEQMLRSLTALAAHPQVVALGECGLDRLHGAALEVQEDVFRRQLELAEQVGKPVTIHCVRAFDVLLRLRKQLRPQQRWTVHGFRGGPALARQLLDAGLDLSFGLRRNADAFNVTPPGRRHEETD